MDKDLAKKLDKLISLQESILRELRRERKAEVSSSSLMSSLRETIESEPLGRPGVKGERSGKGPYAGVTWEEWDAMNSATAVPGGAT